MRFLDTERLLDLNIERLGTAELHLEGERSVCGSGCSSTCSLCSLSRCNSWALDVAASTSRVAIAAASSAVRSFMVAADASSTAISRCAQACMAF